MSELELYKKMYAKVFSETDSTLALVVGALESGDCTREKLTEVAGKLKQALLDAEDMYLNAE